MRHLEYDIILYNKGNINEPTINHKRDILKLIDTALHVIVHQIFFAIYMWTLHNEIIN